MNVITEYHAEYFTATILDWKKLLKPDKYKDIIVNSLAFLVQAGLCNCPEDYKYSSIGFYEKGISPRSWLIHYILSKLLVIRPTTAIN